MISALGLSVYGFSVYGFSVHGFCTPQDRTLTGFLGRGYSDGHLV